MSDGERQTLLRGSTKGALGPASSYSGDSPSSPSPLHAVCCVSVYVVCVCMCCSVQCVYVYVCVGLLYCMAGDFVVHCQQQFPHSVCARALTMHICTYIHMCVCVHSDDDTCIQPCMFTHVYWDSCLCPCLLRNGNPPSLGSDPSRAWCHR